MKKVIMLFCAFALLSLNQAFAQTTATNDAQEATASSTAVAPAQEVATPVANTSNEVEVAVADLPQEVQAALNGSDYEGWTVSKAFIVKKEDTQLYKVILARGDEERKVKMTADGKLYEHTKDKG